MKVGDIFDEYYSDTCFCGRWRVLEVTDKQWTAVAFDRAGVVENGRVMIFNYEIRNWLRPNKEYRIKMLLEKLDEISKSTA